MGVYKLSAAGGLTTPRTNYSSFLAGNPAVSFGSYESIATVTVGGGGAANVEFTSIPSTYTHLEIRSIIRSNRTGGDDDSFIVNFNSDTGSNYSYHYMFGNGVGPGVGATASQTKIFIPAIPATGSRATSIFAANVMSILDYKNTNKYKTIKALGNFDANGAGSVSLTSGLWQNTNAITSIKLQVFEGTGFEQYTQFALYGIKGS